MIPWVERNGQPSFPPVELLPWEWTLDVSGQTPVVTQTGHTPEMFTQLELKMLN